MVSPTIFPLSVITFGTPLSTSLAFNSKHKVILYT